MPDTLLEKIQMQLHLFRPVILIDNECKLIISVEKTISVTAIIAIK